MKYILMMSGTKPMFDWYATWSKQDLQAQFAFMRAFSKELKDSGTFVATEGLAFGFRKDSRISRRLLECAEEAYRIAARASAAPGPGGTPANIPIEVRQIMSGPPEEFQ